jgi:hypothetical protein
VPFRVTTEWAWSGRVHRAGSAGCVMVVVGSAGARRGYLLVVAGAAEQEPEQQAEPEEHGGRDEDYPAIHAPHATELHAARTTSGPSATPLVDARPRHVPR